MSGITDSLSKLIFSVDKNTMLIILGVCFVLGVVCMIKRAFKSVLLMCIVMAMTFGMNYIHDEILIKNHISMNKDVISINSQEFKISEIEDMKIHKKDSKEAYIDITLDKGDVATVYVPIENAWIMQKIGEQLGVKVTDLIKK